MKTITLTVKNEKDYHFLLQIAERLGFISTSFFTEKYGQKRKIANRIPGIVDKLCGKYRNYLSSSDDFSARKQWEITKEK